MRWTIVLPLKGGPSAKSRLEAGPELARALAADTLTAVLACPVVSRTVVVTADPGTAAEAASAGADVVGESGPGDGLVAAVRDGVAAAGPGPVAVLLGDLPALRPEDLTDGLSAVHDTLRDRPAASMAAVPDAAGTGTVLLAARGAADLDPAFGPGSLVAHVRRGAVRVEIVLPRLRQDVDTPDDLRTALGLGVGRRTAGTLRANGTGTGGGPRAPGPRVPGLS
ncbi:MAG: 2-phospho-L-lactate/phosphoenolpyruvate guanylyltransferase [Actinomycetota bacterium]|nr:2-phospho-L-lactate/phosphoenolpyruvate guanylyltransferase [Actinomycetota bacterium]